LKVLPDGATASGRDRERFMREVHAVAALCHQHIVPFIDAGEDGGTPFLVMRMLAGEMLKERLKVVGRLPVAEALRIGGEMAEGLAAAHAGGIVHRDVKPSNIWLEDPDGNVRLIDFGLAQCRGREGLTRTGQIPGTAGYFAPEQGKRGADYRVDLFSLGVVLYEMLTGRRPFAGDNHLEYLFSLVNGSPQRPGDLNRGAPRELSTLIVRLLAVNVQERHPDTAREAAARLCQMRNALNAPLSVRRPAPSEPIPAVVATAPQPPVDLDAVLDEFVEVPPGTFWMGGGGGVPGDRQAEIAKGFGLAIHPVTQGKWLAVMGHNPSWFSRTGVGKDRVEDISDADLRQFPVECVSWDDVQQFLAKLNEKNRGGEWTYRLVTEAEWEYACRGAASSQAECAFSFYLDRPANSLSSAQANSDGNYPDGGAPKGPYLERTTKVGSYKPNRLGLFDMHGNVWEWCSDWYEEGTSRVIRGGSWNNSGSYCRASDRRGSAPADRDNDVGFRLARVPSGE
jgi:formylglycine-generating enzyme required for sulfatase activity